MVEDLVKLMHKNICICKSAAAKIDELKSEKIADQKTLIECQQKQLESVKTTVETEMKSWSDVVKNNTAQIPSAEAVKKAVRSAVDLNDRSRSFIIYGATEKVGNKPMKPDAVIQDVFLDLNNQSLSMSNPQVTAVRRIGTPKSDLENAARPIKVTLTNPEEVKVVLSKSNLLKKYRDIYIYFYPKTKKLV